MIFGCTRFSIDNFVIHQKCIGVRISHSEWKRELGRAFERENEQDEFSLVKGK